MLDSSWVGQRRRGGEGERGRGEGGVALTLHETFLDNLAEALHLGLGQVFALLGLFQPLVGAGALGQTGRPGLGNVTVSSHGRARSQWRGRAATASAAVIRREMAKL
jgi:hypothetical protein